MAEPNNGFTFCVDSIDLDQHQREDVCDGAYRLLGISKGPPINSSCRIILELSTVHSQTEALELAEFCRALRLRRTAKVVI